MLASTVAERASQRPAQERSRAEKHILLNAATASAARADLGIKAGGAMTTAVTDIGTYGLAAASTLPASRLRDLVKRTEDVLIAFVVVVLASPVMLLVAIAIRIESPGPVLFRQRRVGFNNEIFEIWKFRSMYHHRADYDGSRQTCKNDPRVTRVGRIIRKFSVDELPQLLNVLQGRMSIVGPRPHAVGTTVDGQHLEALVPSYPLRHRVKPGLTGWAQIKGLRGELDSAQKLERRVQLDLEYVENWSLLLDLRIIFVTIGMVLRDCRAY